MKLHQRLFASSYKLKWFLTEYKIIVLREWFIWISFLPMLALGAYLASKQDLIATLIYIRDNTRKEALRLEVARTINKINEMTRKARGDPW